MAAASHTPDMFTNLPPELLEQICKENVLYQDSLRNLRLVCKSLNAASSPFVFDCIHISPLKRSLRNLHALSRSPLARHVDLIICHPDEIPNWNNKTWTYRAKLGAPSEGRFEAWENPMSMNLGPPPHSKEQLVRGWSVYSELVKEQQSWREDHEGRQMKYCLSSRCFPNLKEAVIQRAKPRQEFSNDGPYWKHLFRDILVGPENWETEAQDSEANFTEGIFTLLFLETLGVRNQDLQPGMRPITALALDLSTSITFDQLIMEAHGTGSVPADHDDRLQSVMNAFRPLKRLAICCPHAPISNDGGGRTQAKEIHQFLSLATDLEDLDLEYGEFGYQQIEGPGLDLNLGLDPFLTSPGVQLPNLHTLKICSSLPGQVYASFLTTHSATLRKLEMTECVSDDWKPVWMAIARDLHLHTLCIRNVHTATKTPGGTISQQRYEGRSHFISDSGLDVERPSARHDFVLRSDPKLKFNQAMAKFFAGNDTDRLPDEYFEADKYFEEDSEEDELM